MKSKDITHLIFTDVETTGKEGPNTRLDQIVELAAVKVCLADRSITDSFTALIKPTATSDQVVWTDGGWTWDLGKFHLDAGHFAGADWHGPGVLPLDEALYQFVIRFAPGATFAGQNVPFDLDHIQRDCAACGIPWPETDYHRVDICSPAIFLVMAGAVPGISLKHTRLWARDRVDVKGWACTVGEARTLGEQQHRAMADVYDTINVFFAVADVMTEGLKRDMVPQREPWGPAR
jgi:DNA polymerase III epsilon subunit-like protein